MGFLYLALFIDSLFAFQVKRKQRAIPVVKPPENTSLQFTETLSKLYLLKGDHRDMALKKMTHFLEHVRTRYQMSTTKLDQRFRERLSAKSGVTLKVINELFRTYQDIQNQSAITEQQFLQLNKLIQHFKKNPA